MRTRINADGLRDLRQDVRMLGTDNLINAQAQAVGATLGITRETLQRRLNRAIEGGPATRFISDLAIASNLGRRGRISTGRQSALPSARDFRTTRSGRVFIQDVQAKILDDALSSATVNKITFSSGRTLDPFTVPDNLRSRFLSGGSEGRRLILKKNRRGNVVRFRRGALGALKAAARDKNNENYFEVTRNQTHSGLRLTAGIYRREDNGRSGSRRKRRIFKVVNYQQNISFKKLGRKFDFEKIAVDTISRTFNSEMDRALDPEMRRAGFV